VRKVLLILVLVASLVSQGLVFAQELVDIDAAIHAASHASAPHHHDGDATHYDSSDESLQHMHADHCCVLGGPAVRPLVLDSPLLRDAKVVEVPESPPPDPFLEGPRRPPRSAA
jgi:hypothetical protein